MTTISDLSGDLVGEFLSRVPLTSLSVLRSTCKTWNDLSKSQIFGKKAAAARKQQFLEFMMIDSKVCSLRFDLQGIRNDHEIFVDPSMKKIRKLQQFEMSQVLHCDGLLLCLTKDHSRLMVWNPYLGESRWIQPRNNFNTYDWYALGYDNNNNRNHKISRFAYDGHKHDIDVYDFSSNSWRVLDITPNGEPLFYHTGVSLKGNTYFFGQEVTTMDEAGENTKYLEVTDIEDYLLCFDFTTERFGPHLPLPFHPEFPSFETVTLSWVRDEKLGALYNHYDTYEIIEIWISTKIEPDAVSWSAFLTLDMTLIDGLPDDFSIYFQAKSFFIDEENVVVLFDREKFKKTEICNYLMACIIGEDGYFKSVNIREAFINHWNHCKLVCSSYVPSLVRLKINRPAGKKKRKR